jgi:hypothetical protein
MLLEYLEDSSAQTPQVLLLYDFVPADVEALRGVVGRLGQAESGYEERIDALPGLVGIDGCSLVVSVGGADTGVEPAGGALHGFRCVLRPASWQHIFWLLEPFAVGRANGFQYLTEVGSVEWIISTSRGW